MSEEENRFISSEEKILIRHRAEAKELQGKVQHLKKSINKDKKRKKDVHDEIAALEKDLQERHAAEIAEFKKPHTDQPEISEEIESLHISNDSSAQPVSTENGPELNEEETCSSENKKVSRAEKRRHKKALASRERERMLKEAEKINKFSARNVEADKIKKLLKEKNLQMHEINPDGNCLYAAIVHQLGPGSVVSEMRSKAAGFMRSHQDDFLPFITDPTTGDLLTPIQFEEYCSQLESTSAWGGQPELRALSQVLRRRIEVLQAEGSPIIFGEEFKSEKGLLLAYYRHYYGLGEHYNSVAPLQDEAEET